MVDISTIRRTPSPRILKDVQSMQVYKPLPPAQFLHQDHLSRRLYPTTTRLRTLSASQDSRLAIATQSNISILHPQRALSHLYRTLQRSPTLDRAFRITQSVRVPSVGHELIYSNPVNSGRKDTTFASSDIVSFTWCNDEVIFVCGRGGVFRISASGEWGCVVAVPEATFVPVENSAQTDKGFMSDALSVKATTLGGELIMILGRKSCLEVYALQNGDPEWRLKVREGYVLTIDTVGRVAQDGEKLLVAGGGDGVVTVHELWDGCRKQELIWKMDGVQRLRQVSCVSFTEGALRAEISLAIAASNGFVVVDLVKGNVAGVHAVEEAHQAVQFVSGSVVCVDGSIVTGGLDGNVFRWKLGVQDDERLASCDVIQTAGDREELVRSVEGTANGFGVFVLTTSRRSNQEIRDVEDATLPKFAASARRTMVSLYVPQITNVHEVESAIVGILAKLESSVYYDKALCMWDVELFLTEYDCDETGLLDRLSERFFDMVRVHEKREGELLAYYQRARVMLWLARLLLRVSRDEERIKKVSAIRSELRNSLLSAHYASSLSKFRSEGTSEELSDMERKALECMCQFVSVCKTRFNVDASDMKSCVMKVRELLPPFLATGESSTPTCPVCATGLPLVADAHEPETFYCAHGDVFTRCVRTALPVTSVLSLVCVSCDSRSEKLEPFSWLSSQKCPLCNAVMQQSSGEPF